MKCPSCGAAMVWNPEKGLCTCPSCGREEAVETKPEPAEDKSASGKTSKRKDKDEALKEVTEDTAKKKEEGRLPVYCCESCGAELLVEDTSAAMTCPYCGNNIVLTERVSGALKPDGVIPFKIPMKELEAAVKDFYKDKSLLPRDFFNQSRMSKVQGVYVPFWVFDCDVDGEIEYSASKSGGTVRSGDYLIVSTDHYRLERAVSARFEGLPVDASQKMDDALMDSIEPFDNSAIVPFDFKYLAGYVADRFDEGSEEARKRSDERVKNTTAAVARGEATAGYHGASTSANRLSVDVKDAKYILMPVYMFTVDYKGRKYEYAMNGQTGKVVGELPSSDAVARSMFWKRFALIFAALFLAFSFLCHFDYAQARTGDFNNSVYRINDLVDVIENDIDFKAENAKYKDAIHEMQFDTVLMLIHDGAYKDEDRQMTFGGYLEWLYDKYELGYGINNDGIILGVDTTNEQMTVRTYGRGKLIWTKRNLDYLIRRMQAAYEANGYEGIEQKYLEVVQEVVGESDIPRSYSAVDYEYEYVPGIEPLEKGDKPSWYVTDADNFVDFHDPYAARLLDHADLFGDDEEGTIRELEEHITNEYGIDVVVLTEKSTGSIGHDMYAADYYTYNGYGIGDDFNGLILLVCMDDEHRGFYTASCGALREKMTQSTCNELDDLLYYSFKEGEYGEGVEKWFGGLENVAKYGVPNPAIWHIKYLEEGVATYPDQLVVDEIGILSSDRIRQNEDFCKKVAKDYGLPVHMYITNQASTLEGGITGNTREITEYYLDKFYETQGYQAADDKAAGGGLMVGFFRNQSYGDRLVIRQYGKAKTMVDPKVIRKLERRADDQNVFDCLASLRKNLDFVMRKGRLRTSGILMGFYFVLALIIAFISSLVNLSIARKRMTVVSKALGASKYLVSISVRVIADKFINTTTESIYSPEKDDSDSSSSSSGGSSYSSSYSSSSGRSFTGSGRSF